MTSSPSSLPSVLQPNTWRRLPWRQDFVVFVLFLAVATGLSLQTDTFLTAKNLANLSRHFSWLAIVAFGQSLVIIIGGIDLSVGATMALAGLVTARSMQLGVPVPGAVFLGLMVGGLIGLLNGVLVARVRLPAFVVTLATMSLARGIAYGLTRGWTITNMPDAFLALGQYDLRAGTWSIPVPFLIAIGAAVIVSLLLNRTVLGGYIYALSAGERSLTASGINVVRLKVFVYTLCGLFAAAGGLVLTARLGVATPTASVGAEVDVVAAAVVGGTSLFGGIGNIFGVLLGAAVIQMVYNGLVLLGIPSYWQILAVGLMVLTAVLLDYSRRRRGEV